METLEEGDKVLAKLPNSELYQMGTITMIRGRKYMVQFEGGSQHSVDRGDISRKSRSGSRTRKPEQKSPSRRRSPARKRSPARASARSPARRSPPALKNRSRKSPTGSQSRSDDEKGSRTDSLSAASEAEDVALASRVTRRSIRVLSSLKKKDDSPSRTTDRAVSLPVERKIYEYLSESKERFSVQREPEIQKLDYEAEVFPDSSTVVEKGKEKIELISKPQEWFGWLGALCLIVILPAAAILPQISCFNNKCHLTTFRFPQKLISYLNLRVALVYIGFLMLLAISQLIPIGRLVDGQPNRIGRLQYRINGLLSALLLLIGCGTLEFYQFKPADYIIKSIFKFSLYGWAFGTIVAIYLYIKAGKMPLSHMNLHASTGNVIYDFWQGREINPRLGGFDFKLFFTRYAIITTLLIDAAVIYKSVQDADIMNLKGFNVPALTVAILQAIYCLDALLFESTTLTSFKVLYEGTGYLTCVGSSLYPFFATIGTRYLLLNKNEPSPYVLAAVISLFITGFALYRYSNSKKDKFRHNPYSQEFSKVATILTSTGKKLILSRTWGFVRHPNYLGDILMHWALALIVLGTDWLLYYPAVCTTIILMHRAARDNARCSSRYSAAWNEYCSSVKSRIIKYVY